jgi:hypothetical protein
MVRRRQSGSKKAKKEFERQQREIAERKAKARIESEKRQERIKELWNLLMSGELMPKHDESEDVARDLKSEIQDVFDEWKTERKGESEKGLRRRQEDTDRRRSSAELVRSLVELVRSVQLSASRIKHC